MTTQEYETKFSEDDAPGWDAIAGMLEKSTIPQTSATMRLGYMRV